MNVKKLLSAAAISGALGFSITRVSAHAPAAVLPVHHATSLALLSAHKVAPSFFTIHPLSSASLVHSQLTELLGISGAARAQSLFNKQLVSQGLKVGLSKFPGGVITGGTFTGSGFYNGIVGGSSSYIAGGAGSVVFGNVAQANGSNVLNFVPHVSGIPLVHTTLPISAALRAALQRNNNYLFGGVALGQSSFGGKIIAGELAGTVYYQSGPGYNATANALIAFGNDPLNRSFPLFTPVTGIVSGGYIKFANGITENVTNGSLLFNKVSLTLFPAFPSRTLYYAIGSNPLDTKGPFTTATIPVNYLYFKR